MRPATMKPRERYLATLRGEPTDCLPRVPILMQFAAEYVGSNYGLFASDHRILAEANLACAREFGFDQLSAISDPYRETAGFGGKVVFVENGVPQCEAPLGDDEEIDLDKLEQPDPLASPRMRDRIEGVRLMYEQGGDEYSIMGWVEGPGAEAGDLRGVGTFLMDLVDAEDALEHLLERTTANAIRFALAQIEAGADTIGIGEALASQVSAPIYGARVFPHLTRLVRAIREAGAFVKLHICGNITHLLPLIRRLPINIIDLDHMVDPRTAREALGERVVICTNLDPVSEVRNGNSGSIRLALRDRYERLGNPCMVNGGCEIPVDTPYHNLRALCYPVVFDERFSKKPASLQEIQV